MSGNPESERARERPARFETLRRHRAELLVWALGAVALALRLAVSAGLPPGVLQVHCWVTGLAGLAVVWMPGKRLWLDGPRLVLLAVGLWSLPSVYGRVGGDGVEYFVQARSLLFDRDLDFANDYRGLGAAPIVTAEGTVTSRPPVGTALFWIPALAAAHLGAVVASWIGADVATNGFSPYYQTAVTTSTFFYGFLAVLFLEAALRRRYRRSVAALAAVGIWLATPLHFYMVANPFMSHGVSALAGTFFVLSWWRARESSDLGPWLVTGACAALVTLVRAQDWPFLLIPLFDLILRFRSRSARPVAAFLAVPLGAAGLQASIWFALYGVDFVRTLLGQGRLGTGNPHVADFLLSPRHGLLTWTPLFAASLVGWLLLLRREKRMAAAVWLAFAVAVTFNSAIEDWWASDSFGQRRMLGMIPLFAWGLAETLEALRSRPAALLTAGILALCLWNAQLAWIYNSTLLATRNDALTLDRVSEAQVDLLYRRLLRSHSWMPPSVWVVLYDNLKGVWLDEGARSLDGLVDIGEEPADYYPLVGEGWFEPEMEGRTSFRQSRGRRSWLTIPLRDPRDYELVVRARKVVEGFPVSVRLDVNGTPVGEVELSPGWLLYRFDIAEENLRPGLNELVLLYSKTPRAEIAGFRGKNAVLAVDWLQFEPATDARRE